MSKADDDLDLIVSILKGYPESMARSHALLAVKWTKAELDRLRSEVEAMRKDAERYKQLRRGQKWSVVDGIGDALRADTLDAAIDAAMGEKS